MRALPTFVVSAVVGAMVVGVTPSASANQPSATHAAAQSGLAHAASGSSASAAVRAATSGAPVVVDELTTPTSLTKAMPDGSMQLEQSTIPIRVRRDSGWIPVDTDLHRDGDWFSPAASAAPVRFSAGGSEVMSQTQTASGEWVSESWTNGVLPAPKVGGDTATYTELMPGVDLKLVATATGMTSVYVVKSEQAAKRGGLSKLRVAVDGAELTASGPGGVTAKAADGSTLIADQPLWWDSSGGATYKRPGKEMPPAPVTHSLTSNDVTMDVGASVDKEQKRSGKTVKYPIYVDPDWSPGLTASWDTDRAYPDAQHLTTDPLYVGEYAQWRSDMFFRYPISSIAGKQILNAVLNTTLVDYAACPAGPISSHFVDYTSIPGVGFTWNQEQSMISSGQMSWSATMQSWAGSCSGGGQAGRLDGDDRDRDANSTCKALGGPRVLG